MSHVELERFCEALKVDPELAAPFDLATSIEDLAGLIRAAGFDVTRQDLIDHGGDAGLRDEQLEAVAGGAGRSYASYDSAGSGVAYNSFLERRGRQFGP